jgi:hypothetical protein
MRVSRPSRRLSFDDLIELRFLPSRRRRRDPEYFEQLKSMIMPREVNYRVSREDRRAGMLAVPGSHRLGQLPELARNYPCLGCVARRSQPTPQPDHTVSLLTDPAHSTVHTPCYSFAL